MPKYRLYYTTVAETYIDVEAEDQDAAIDEAADVFTSPQLCAHCSGWGKGVGIELGEWEPVDGPDGIQEVSA